MTIPDGIAAAACVFAYLYALRAVVACWLRLFFFLLLYRFRKP